MRRVRPGEPLHLSPRALTFLELDGIGFAAERGRFDPKTTSFVADELGPVFELGLLAKSKTLPWPGNDLWLAMNGISPLIGALSNRRHQWVCPSSRAVGVYRTFATPDEEGLSWVQFGLAIRAAAIAAGFSNNLAAQLVGAIGEMQDNIYQHSQAPQTGIVAFKARPGALEFVVCDSGIGVLKSLTSCSEFQDVAGHGEALRLTLSDGVSRHGRDSGRGLGYRPLFTGLANLRGVLRFRSGDYALTIEGENPGAIPAKLGQKTSLQGFFASVTCRC